MLKKLCFALIALGIVLGILECSLRALRFIRVNAVSDSSVPYILGNFHGPPPPWAPDWRLLESDCELFWRGKSDIHRAYIDVFTNVYDENERISLLFDLFPKVPKSLVHRPRFVVRTNSHGFRGDEFKKKQGEVLRVVCLGDSWTFGSNVKSSDSYPVQLQEKMSKEFRLNKFEVINLGVLGYSSFQGRKIAEKIIPMLKPDVVVIGYGFNDSMIEGWQDSQLSKTYRRRAILQKVQGVIESLALVAGIKYSIYHLLNAQSSLTDRLKAAIDTSWGTGYALPRSSINKLHWEQPSEYRRVSLLEYEDNILAIVKEANNHGAIPLLLYNDFALDSPYLDVLKKIAAVYGLCLVDSAAILLKERAKKSRSMDDSYGLNHHITMPEISSEKCWVIFRVTYPSDPDLPPFVMGMGLTMVPNSMRLYDDGTHGDQIADDGVWSLAVQYKKGARVSYVYTNGAESGKFVGVDVPYIRGFMVPEYLGSQVLVRPIDIFGEVVLHADTWHTNSKGYELIANQLVKKLSNNMLFKNKIKNK